MRNMGGWNSEDAWRRTMDMSDVQVNEFLSYFYLKSIISNYMKMKEPPFSLDLGLTFNRGSQINDKTIDEHYLLAFDLLDDTGGRRIQIENVRSKTSLITCFFGEI